MIKHNISDAMTLKEVVINGHRYYKNSLSPVKIAEMNSAIASQDQETDRSPNMVDDCEYVYNNRGKLVKLEHFDPSTMEEFILTPTTRLNEEQLQQLLDSSNLQNEPDDECPESSPEQIERFRLYGINRNKQRAEAEKIRRLHEGSN